MGLLSKLFGSKKNQESGVNEMEGESLTLTVDETTDPVIDKGTAVQADTLKFDALRASRMGELSFAITAFRKSLELRPEFETRFYLVDALIAGGLSEEALYEMHLLLEEMPEHKLTLLRRATLYLNEGKDHEALADIERALTSRPEEQEEWAAFVVLHAKALQRLERLEDALTVTNELLTEIADHSGALLLKCRILQQMDRLDEAEETLRQTAKLLPEEEHIPLQLGQIALRRGMTQQAIALGHATIDLDPFNVAARILISQALEQEDRSNDAIITIQTAMEEVGEERSLMLRLIDLYEISGQAAEASSLRENLSDESEVNTQSTRSNFDNLYTGGIY